MPAGRPILGLSVVLVAACGRATVREVSRAEIVIDELEIAADRITVSATNATCPDAKLKIVILTDAETGACLGKLAKGAKVEVIVRRLQFKPMTIGDKPTVTHTFGPCTLPQGAMQLQDLGARCAGSGSAR